jgi:probable F420-dependent oxidoreductase
MHISVEFPSVAYREGPAKVVELARGLEAIGYDDLAIFDHVVMGHPTERRRAPMYPPRMPILEALVTLAFVASATERMTLSTEVLILPQRQPVLVAKQVATLDTLSGGRVRLGVGVGWQEAEYEALGEEFERRGRRMDESIRLLRACWGDELVEEVGDRFRLEAIAMEPKPPQGAGLPIWVGGTSAAACRRVGALGDGWMGSVTGSDEDVRQIIAQIRRSAEEAGRDPDSIGLQAMLAPPPRDPAGKVFYQDLDRVAGRAEHLASLGFGWLAVNATAVFQSGARTVDALVDALGSVHDRLRRSVS